MRHSALSGHSQGQQVLTSAVLTYIMIKLIIWYDTTRPWEKALFLLCHLRGDWSVKHFKLSVIRLAIWRQTSRRRSVGFGLNQCKISEFAELYCISYFDIIYWNFSTGLILQLLIWKTWRISYRIICVRHHSIWNCYNLKYRCLVYLIPSVETSKFNC